MNLKVHGNYLQESCLIQFHYHVWFKPKQGSCEQIGVISAREWRQHPCAAGTEAGKFDSQKLPTSGPAAPASVTDTHDWWKKNTIGFVSTKATEERKPTIWV